MTVRKKPKAEEVQQMKGDKSVYQIVCAQCGRHFTICEFLGHKPGGGKCSPPSPLVKEQNAHKKI